ncbi:MAG: ATP-binding protein [Kofleriaceae bacterium]
MAAGAGDMSAPGPTAAPLPAPDDADLRARHTTVFHGVIAVTIAVYSVGWAVLGVTAPVVLGALSVVALAGNWLRWRWTRWQAGYANVGIALGVGNIFVLTQLAGRDMPIAMAWNLFAPVFGWVLGSRRASVGWTVVAIGCVVVNARTPYLLGMPLASLDADAIYVLSCFHAGSMVVMAFLAMTMMNRNHQAYLATLAAHQAALEQTNQTLARAQRYKDRFFASVSHELRTPMNAITGIAELLQAGADDRDQLLRSLSQSSTHLLAIINDLLDLTKLTENQLALVEADFDLEEALRSAVAMAQAAQPAALEVEVAVELPPGLPRYVRGDRRRVVQVVVNLVANALKFTHRGSVRVRATATPAGAGHAIRLDVVDTGIGIAAAAQPTLFDAFVQADASIALRYGGTGLGLGIARRLVELMGGRLSFTSTPGVGSHFMVDLTLAPGHAQAAPPEPLAADAAVEATAPRLLVVDDNRLNVMVAVRLLARLVPDAVIDTAEDGEAALACVRAHGYALVFMDMQMPTMDGATATRYIRALPDPARAAVPVVAMTANTDSTDLQACLAAGMNLALSKPVTSQSLRQVLRQFLQADVTATANWPALVTPPQPSSGR